MNRILLIIILLISGQMAWAHVGSSGVLMQGQAGAYKVLVNVEPPDVIPGTARVTLFVQSGELSRVAGRPISFRSGVKGAPSADGLLRVPGQNGQFQGAIWLMEPGSSGIQLELEGKNGKEELVVPIVAVSTAQREMPASLGWGLGVVGLLLVALMVTTVGASVSDGIMPPGEALTEARKKKRAINMVVAAAVCTLLIWGGSTWWDSWANDYKRHLYKPMTGQSQVTLVDSQQIFQLKIDLSEGRSRRNADVNTLIPDHGKLMHLFLVRAPGLDAFAHIHPERVDSVTFQAYLPGLPAGKYLVYADVVHYSGFAETITDTLEIPSYAQKSSLNVTDVEDTYVVTQSLEAPEKLPSGANVVLCGSPGTKTRFKDGSYAVWEGSPEKSLEVGVPYELSFELFNPDGSPSTPEPYLGMSGHVAIVRSDGSVYIHLHPTGTYAMAAGQSLQNRIADTSSIYERPSPAAFRDSIDRYLEKLKQLPLVEREALLASEMTMRMGGGGHKGMEHSNRITFPYSFPKEGQYRIFLQVKRKGQVQTGIFDAKVIRGTGI